jgi:hypothetical protein
VWNMVLLSVTGTYLFCNADVVLFCESSFCLFTLWCLVWQAYARHIMIPDFWYQFSVLFCGCVGPLLSSCCESCFPKSGANESCLIVFLLFVAVSGIIGGWHYKFSRCVYHVYDGSFASRRFRMVDK